MEQALKVLEERAKAKFKTAVVGSKMSRGIGFVWVFWPEPRNPERAPVGFRGPGVHGSLTISPKELVCDVSGPIGDKIADACAAMTAEGFDWKTGAWA